MFIIICPVSNSTSSVTFAVRFITSFTVTFVNDLFIDVFTIGNILSMTVIIVSLVLQLPAVSLTLIV